MAKTELSAKQKTRRLTESAVMIALGTVLSFITVYKLPYGGSITLFSMVPIILIGFKYGLKWGFCSGLVFAVLQAILGATASQAFAGMYDPNDAAASVFKMALMALLDYIVAFSVLGLSGLYRRKLKNDVAGVTLGGATVVLFRFLAHFFSGWILWGSYAEWYFGENMNNEFGRNVLAHFSGQGLAAFYSFIYNGSYMLPELVITVVVLALLMAVKPLRAFATKAE